MSQTKIPPHALIIEPKEPAAYPRYPPRPRGKGYVPQPAFIQQEATPEFVRTDDAGAKPSRPDIPVSSRASVAVAEQSSSAALGSLPELSLSPSAYQRLVSIESAFRVAPLGLCVLDLNLRFVAVNTWFARRQGLDESTVPGRSIFEVQPAWAGQLAERAKEVRKTNKETEMLIALAPAAQAEAGTPAEALPYRQTVQPLHNGTTALIGFLVSLAELVSA